MINIQKSLRFLKKQKFQKTQNKYVLITFKQITIICENICRICFIIRVALRDFAMLFLKVYGLF